MGQLSQSALGRLHCINERRGSLLAVQDSLPQPELAPFFEDWQEFIQLRTGITSS